MLILFYWSLVNGWLGCTNHTWTLEHLSRLDLAIHICTSADNLFSYDISHLQCNTRDVEDVRERERGESERERAREGRVWERESEERRREHVKEREREGEESIVRQWKRRRVCEGEKIRDHVRGARGWPFDAITKAMRSITKKAILNKNLSLVFGLYSIALHQTPSHPYKMSTKKKRCCFGVMEKQVQQYKYTSLNTHHMI